MTQGKRIKQLSRHLINQIAAGEVIERPASVVKELVENSIDAGATKIEVEISNACQDIRVSDNGSGIYPDDVELAFSKHATSKISESEDLFNISSLGFRGEALASIISIAKVICTTRTADIETGVRVECEESTVSKSPCGCAVGTTMEVKNLFYNTPVRLKFLKSERVEMSYIAEVIQSIAIANPHVSITLKNGPSTPVHTSGSGDLLCVLTEIYSNSIASELKKVDKSDELAGMRICGYCSTPDFTRSSKKSIYVFVNNRVVKCPVILKSIDTAYKSMLPQGKYPFVCVNLIIPGNDVDVNVHPTKKEVRYKNPNQIFNFIYSAINNALSDIPVPTAGAVEEKNILPFPVSSQSSFFTDNQNVTVKQDSEDDDAVYVSQSTLEIFQEENKKRFETKTTAPKPEFISSFFQEQTQNFRIIGQYRNTYIVFEEKTELKIVDQHIADERYIFEKLMKQRETEIPSQLLLISDVISVEHQDAELLFENQEKLKLYGYEIEKISDTELVFKKIPQILSHVKPQDLIADILESLSGNLNNLEEKMLITISCKAAVKAGQELNIWQMEELIKKWKTTKLPYTCPHGRPILKTFCEKDIASFFHRQ